MAFGLILCKLTTSSLSNRYKGALLYRVFPYVRTARKNAPGTWISGAFCVIAFRTRNCIPCTALRLSYSAGVTAFVMPFAYYTLLRTIRESRAFSLALWSLPLCNDHFDSRHVNRMHQSQLGAAHGIYQAVKLSAAAAEGTFIAAVVVVFIKVVLQKDAVYRQLAGALNC